MIGRDLALLATEGAVYFGVLAGLFRLRRTLGIGLFVTALGTLHFLETYLAASLYVPMPGGLAISPGSTILFSGKLVLLLLVYIKEDAAVVRQPIYGLLVGNFLICGLVLLIRHHALVPATPGAALDLGFLDEMGWLMVWGTLLLYVDAIAIVLLYERLGTWLAGASVLRVFLAAATVLCFDQMGFGIALRWLVGVPVDALIGGGFAKVAAAGFFAVLASLYLRFCETQRAPGPRSLADIFEVLTYRERYQALLAETGRDALTGAHDRRRLDAEADGMVREALAAGRPAGLIVLDLDRFKAINDRFGHRLGDEALRGVASVVAARLGSAGQLYRYGGDEFVVLGPGLDAVRIAALASGIREAVAALAIPGLEGRLGITVGTAAAPEDGGDFAALFAAADGRLLAAKKARPALARARSAPPGDRPHGMEVISLNRLRRAG